MWRIFLIFQTASLLCWSADGQVTCRDNNGVAVDWYIIYKAPKLNNFAPEGLEYLYIDPAGKKTYKDHNNKLIDNPNGVLANTLKPLFTKSMTDNFGFITYNDQPPGCHADNTFGHSKGVVMMDKTTGVWLLHSQPRFPFLRDQNNFWPKNKKGAKVTKNAQTFICVTFKYDQFNKIGEHLLDINAFTFDDHIPNNFHENLQKLRRTENNIRAPRDNKVKIQDLTSAGLTSAGLTSAAGTLFRSFAKKQYKDGDEAEDDECDDEPPTKKPKTTKEPKGEYVGDLYLTIAETYKTDVSVQTWCGNNEGCYSGGRKVFKITLVKTKLGNVLTQWRPGNDHSKWCVAKDNNNHLICIADVNRAVSQYKRPGGGLCFVNQQASELFKGVIDQTKECP